MGVTQEDPAQNPADPRSADGSADRRSGDGAADLWQPPWWLLAFAPLCWLLITALLVNHRGWPIALTAAALLAPLGMPIPAILRWIKHHPAVAGAYTAPLTFAATTLLTTLPLWLCVSATLATTLLALLITTTRTFAQS